MAKLRKREREKWGGGGGLEKDRDSCTLTQLAIGFSAIPTIPYMGITMYACKWLAHYTVVITPSPNSLAHRRRPSATLYPTPTPNRTAIYSIPMHTWFMYNYKKLSQKRSFNCLPHTPSTITFKNNTVN